jgi:hypothetical protein
VVEKKQPEKRKAVGDRAFLVLVVVAAGWLVPGLGHLLLHRWGRALVFFVGVGALATTGLALRGNIFSASSGDAFDMLGFFADFGAGIFYFVSKFIEHGGPDVSRAAGDYGTRFFATAGVLNLLCVLDAHEIARGRKA